MQPSDIEKVIARHGRIGLQFSGGKDSLACLYLLRPYWDRLTVYWLNSGDVFPETAHLIEQVRRQVPQFAEIAGNVRDVQARFGIPSDIVPASSTPLGRMVGHAAPLIQDRYSCCFKTVMEPMHLRMIADGITLIIRGQRADDKLKAPIRSGTVDAGIEYLFPIEDWTARMVIAYLREQDAPVPRFYQVLGSAPDCMSCSAWWDEGRANYLKRYHHDAYLQYQARLDTINAAVGAHIATFNKEVNT